MLTDSLRSMYWQLPTGIKRALFRCTKASKYRHNQWLRANRDGEYTLRPFDQHKCIFVHLPKTAGVSVSKSLWGNLAGGHVMLRIYEMIFSPEEFASYFKFTFVRNPWDRLVSAFTFLKSGGLNERDRVWSAQNLAQYDDFDAFVKGWLNRRNVADALHFIPQVDFLRTRGPKLRVDFIGRFENLAQDFAFVQRRLEMQAPADLQFLNKTSSRKRDYRTYYTDETRRIVESVYADDIKLLGYSFGGDDETSVTRDARGDETPTPAGSLV